MKWFQYENWSTAWQNQQNDLCAQPRIRSAWASTQSSQSQRCPPEAKLCPKLPIERTAKTLIRLGGCPGWSESSLGTKVILLGLSWGGSKCFFLESIYAAYIHFITFFTFRIELSMKSFSHANNIVLGRDIYIHSLNWCQTDQTFLSCKRNMVCSNSAIVWLCKGRLRCRKCRFGKKGV